MRAGTDRHDPRMGVRVGGRIGPFSASVNDGGCLATVIGWMLAIAAVVILGPPLGFVYGIWLVLRWALGSADPKAGPRGAVGAVLAAGCLAAIYGLWPGVYHPMLFEEKVPTVSADVVEATAQLAKKGFTLAAITYPAGTATEHVEECSVSGTAPPSGTSADRGSAVELLMKCPVPAP